MYIGLRLRLFIIIKLKESLGIYEGLYGKIHYALENIPERTSEEQIYVFKGRKKKKEWTRKREESDVMYILLHLLSN